MISDCIKTMLRSIRLFNFGILFLTSVLFSTTTGARQTADKLATVRTVALWQNLQRGKTTLFGHQDDRAYGVGWNHIDGGSDIRLVSGQYPAVYGWDLGHLELDSARNLDGVSFRDVQRWIRQTYRDGAVHSISWHARNPLNGTSAWDTTHGTVASVLPGGSHHELYKQWLDKLARFFRGLRDDAGRPIPVLFRPFHELTGNWFWWCRNACTAAEFKQLWRFTFQYLTEEKGIHHLLWVYNTADFSGEAQFMERYPGNDVVDMLSFDLYQHGASAADRVRFMQQAERQLGILQSAGKKQGKPVSFAETGLEAIPDAKWWTETLYPLLQDKEISYVLVWRNAGYQRANRKMHYYAPFPGQLSAANFNQFSTLPGIGLGNWVKQHNYYQH